MTVDVEWIEASSHPPRPKMSVGEWGQSGIIWLRATYVAKDDRGEVRKPHTFLGRCVWPKKPVAFRPLHNGTNPASVVEWGEDGFYYENLHRVRVGVSHWAPLLEPVFDKEDVSEEKVVDDATNPDCFGFGGDSVAGCQCRKVFAPIV